MADDTDTLFGPKGQIVQAGESDFTRPQSLAELKPASTNVRPKRSGSKPARVDLKPEEFENLIEDQGIYVRLTPSILCPNRTDLGDANHVLDCPLCFGDQVIDVPEQAEETWGFIQGIKSQKDLMNQVGAGIYDIKDATITTKQAVKMYYWYKIEVLDFAAVYNQLLKRGTGTNVDRTRYAPAKPGATVLSVPTDDVLQSTAPDVNYICIDSAGKRYQLGKHYTVKDRNLTWLTANKPASGTLYSLIYPVLPTFRVLELLHEHRYYYVSFKRLDKIPVHLPQQAVIRWDYLAKTSGNQVPIPTAPPTTP
jgi:hypothetical protein